MNDNFSSTPQSGSHLSANEPSSAEPDIAASGTGSAADRARRIRLQQITRNLIVFGALMAMLEFAFMAAGIPAAVYLASVGLALIVLGAVSWWAPRTCSVEALIVFVVGHGAVALFDTRPLVGGWFCNAPTLFVVAFAVVTSFELARPRPLRDAGPLVPETRSPIPISKFPAAVSIPRSRDAFVEKTFAERRQLSLWVIAASMIMGAAAVVALTRDPSYLVAVGPLCSTVIFLFGFRFLFPRRFRITADGIESTRPHTSIRFHEMLGAVADGDLAAGRFAIIILHASRQIRLSSRLTCDSRSLLEFLCRQASGSVSSGKLKPEIEAFLIQQRLFFPADQIHIYRYFPRPGLPNAAATLMRLGSSILLAIPPMLFIHAIVPRSMEWIVFAFVFCSAIIGPIILGFGLYERATCRHRVRRYEGSHLTLTPDGMAIAQAGFAGELKWSEVHGGHFVSDPHAPSAGLALDVGGASIVIADVYDAPIGQIAEEIERAARIRFRR